jgi:hypothetical protein
MIIKIKIIEKLTKGCCRRIDYMHRQAESLEDTEDLKLNVEVYPLYLCMPNHLFYTP